MIDISTKFITLIGTPLGQSFAARMQNRAYEAMGLTLKYFYTEADSAHLGEIISGVRYMPSFLGCAVTKPNKVKVLQYLDELNPLCAKMGACNTVVKTPDSRLIGHNTDGMGFYRSVSPLIDIPNTEFFCIGAGGAGRAITSILAWYGAKRIYITDMYPASAQALVCDINEHFAPAAECAPLEKVSECGMVINATGIGMGSTIGQTPIPAAYIRPDQFCFDACYNPEKTQFLLNAEAKGCRIMNGLDMSLYQGAAQIELWTGQPAPIEVMRQELLDILKEKEARS